MRLRQVISKQHLTSHPTSPDTESRG